MSTYTEKLPCGCVMEYELDTDIAGKAHVEITAFFRCPLHHASTNLLAACEAALRRCEEAKRCMVGRFVGDDELMEQLQSAISEAKGKQ